METKIGSLGIIIPVSTIEQNKSLQDKESIIAWRNNLPLADLGLTSSKVYGALSEIGRTIPNPVNQFEILEIIRILVQNICIRLRKYYINPTTELDDKTHKVIDLAFSLEKNLNLCYKSLLEVLIVDKNPNNNLIAATIHRIIHINSLILLRTYQLYFENANDLWKEINILYKESINRDILNKHVENSQYNDIKANNIADLYKSICIFTITSPYCWRQQEQELLFRISYEWVTKVSLEKDNINNEDNIYLLDIHSNNPPKQLYSLPENDIDKYYVLSSNNLIKHIETFSKNLVNKKNEFSNHSKYIESPEFLLTLPIINRLLKILKQNSLINKNERKPDSGEIEVIFGFKNVHYILNNNQNFNPSQPNTGLDLPSFEVNEEDNEVFSLDDINIIENKEISETNSQKKSNISYLCSIKESSKNGYLLSRKGNHHLPLQSGELICFRNIPKMPKELWRIATIKWLRYGNDGDLRIGVQLLAYYGIAVGAKLTKYTNIDGNYLQCIILPAGKEIGIDNSTIITPLYPFKENSNIEVIYGNEIYGINYLIEDIVETTATYKQFNFKLDINTKSSNIKEETLINKQEDINPFKKNADDNSFDSLWDDL